ncbi:MAG: hypothetical protein L6R38_007955 [Xanthoria sp. 2 TBL-2021]|nr:MAG: hypothetical protein L6R38_007955 [Xanthoria sp. 2 TBL-2021]
MTIIWHNRVSSAHEAPVAKRHEQSQPEQGKADGLQPVADQFVYIATGEVYGIGMDTVDFLCEGYATLEDANRKLQQSSASIRSDNDMRWRQGYDVDGLWRASGRGQKEYRVRYYVRKKLVKPPGSCPPPSGPPVLGDESRRKQSLDAFCEDTDDDYSNEPWPNYL